MPEPKNLKYLYCPHLLLFVVQLVGEDGLHPEEVRGWAPGLGDGHQVWWLRDDQSGLRWPRGGWGQHLGAGEMERWDSNAGQVLGLGLQQRRKLLNRLNGPVNKSICDSWEEDLVSICHVPYHCFKIGNPDWKSIPTRTFLPLQMMFCFGLTG